MAVAFASYAGVSLPLCTAEADALVAAKLPLDRVAAFDAPVPTALLGEVPLPPLPPPPPLKLGTLWWPTSATRFARAHFVVNTAKLTAIRAALVAASGSTNGYYAADLVIDDGTGHSVTAAMRMLPPKPLLGADAAEQAFLLTLVDDRWVWWQKGPAASLGGTWADTVTALAAATGASISIDGSVSAFAAPSAVWADLGSRPLPLLLDAVAHSVGRRVVVALDGTVTLQEYATAKTEDAALWAIDGVSIYRIAGGVAAAADARKTAPAQVIVYGADTSQTVTLASLALADYSGVTGLVGTSGTLRCDADTLTAGQAAAVATEWYQWRLAAEDLRFAGVVDADPNGFYDAAEWAFRGDDVSTRFAAYPQSVGHAPAQSAATTVASDPNANAFEFWALVVGESGSESSGYSYTLRRLSPYESDGDPTTTAATTNLFSTTTFTVSGCREAQHRRVLTVADPGAGVNVPPLTSGSARPRNDYPIVRVNRVVVENGATDLAYYQFHLDQPFDDTRVGHVTADDQICDGRKTALDGWYAADTKQTLEAQYGGSKAAPIAAVEQSDDGTFRVGVFGDVAGGGGASAQVAQLCTYPSVTAVEWAGFSNGLVVDPQASAPVIGLGGIVSTSGSVSGYVQYTKYPLELAALPVTRVSGADASYGLTTFCVPGVVGVGTVSAGGKTLAAALVSNGPFGWEGMSAGGIGTGATLMLSSLSGVSYLATSMNYWSTGTYPPIEGQFGGGTQFVCTDDLVLAHGKTTGAARRFGVRRGGSVAWGGDLDFGVLTYYGTTLLYRQTLYARGGLVISQKLELASPPPPPPPPPPPGGGGRLVVTVQDKAGTPLAGRTVTTTAGGGTTDANGQVQFSGVAAGAGTSTVTLNAGEACNSSASWPGGSNLSNSNSVPYVIVDASETGVVHIVYADAAKFAAATGDLDVLVGGVLVTTNVAVRTPATVVSLLPATHNDYALPSDFKGRTVYLSSSGGASTITGFSSSGVGDGTRVRVLLDSASGNITVNHADAGSTAANRVLTHTGAAKTYSANGGFEMEYDATAARWRIPF